jgi:hypothetical protein
MAANMLTAFQEWLAEPVGTTVSSTIQRAGLTITGTASYQ